MPDKTIDDKMFEFSRKVRAFAMEKIEKAVKENDLAKYIEAAKHVFRAADRNNFAWVFDGLSPGYTFDDYVNEYFNEETRKDHEKDAKLARDMYAAVTSKDAKEVYGFLKQVKPKDEFVISALRRKRDNRTRQYNYRGLAVFPAGTALYFNRLGDEFLKEEPGIVLLMPTTACVEHACDDLFKQFRNEAFHLKYIPWKDISSSVGSSSEGALEYMDGKAKNVHHAANYVFASFTGYFLNQPNIKLPKKFFEGGKDICQNR